MREGYLIFTLFDQNGIETTFTENKKIFTELCTAKVIKGDDEVLDIWDEYTDPDNNNKFEKDNRFSIEALGYSKQPFDNIKILGTFFMDAY